MDKTDVGGWLVIGALGAGCIGAVLGIVYGIVTVAKWAWGGQMAGVILTDADYLEEMKGIEKRLDIAIKQADSYQPEDSVIDYCNEGLKQILKYIKTGV